MPAIDFTTKKDAEDHLSRYQYKGDKSSLVDKSLEDLLKSASIEREGIQYTQMVTKPAETIISSYSSSSGGEDDKIELPERTEPEVTNLYKGSEKRYHEICEVIAAKLIHCSEADLKAFKKDCEDDPAANQTQKDVYKIIKDKYRKSVQDVIELADHLPKSERINLSGPLMLSLNVTHANYSSAVQVVAGEKALDYLREYKDTLLNQENERPSIAQQLKDTGDHIAIKVLKGILLTLGTGLAYGIYALKQAVTGEASYKWIDNPAERLAKNAEKRLFPEEPHYKSMQHLKARKEPEKTDESESQVSQTPTSKGPGPG